MKRVKQAARLTLLAMMTLWFAFSATAVFASSAAQDSHAADQATHEAAADGHGDVAAAPAGHGDDAAAGHGDAHASNSLSGKKLQDLAFRIMNFAVLLFLLVKFTAKPIGSGLAARRKEIKDELEDLEARKQAAQDSYRDFEAKLSTVEQEIDLVVEKAVAQAQVEKTKIIEKAEQAAADIQRQAEMAIQKEIMEARRSLKNEVADQAAVMAEELIVKNLTKDDQVKIVEDYLAKVGAVQ
jgi:F-type H+-transporting ATPase subunit b